MEYLQAILICSVTVGAVGLGLMLVIFVLLAVLFTGISRLMGEHDE